MALKKDKQKVLGETFDDERVRGFLEIVDRDGINSDYARLERAYRSMKSDNFATFIGFFNTEHCDINAKSPRGFSLLQEIQTHQQSTDYCAALRAGGAKL